MSHRAPYFITTHAHACTECGRTFYLCSERDCALAPAVCLGCELDRQDAYFSQLDSQSPTHKELTYGRLESLSVNLSQSPRPRS